MVPLPAYAIRVGRVGVVGREGAASTARDAAQRMEIDMQTFFEQRAGHELCRRLSRALVALGVLLLLFLAMRVATDRLTAKAHAAAASGKAYVGLFKDNAVAVVDLGAQQVVGTVPVPTGPHGVAITPDGRKV